MKNNIKNVLVTGGAGFIGSHVVDALLAAGYGVRVLDSLGPPTHDGQTPEWLDKRAEFLLGDVCVKDDWRRALGGMDAVIHLAAYMDYHPDFSTYVKTNIESVTLLFEVILEEKLSIKKIVAASSQSVYGEGKYECADHGLFYPGFRSEEQLLAQKWEQFCPKCGKEAKPLPEDEDDLLKPLTPYGISKLSSEHFLMNLGRRYGVPTTALRFSIALGPRQSFRHFYSGALRAFAVNVLNNEPIAMNENGEQTRDFINVLDVAAAHIAVLADSRANWQAFNVGSGETTKVIDLARLVAEEAKVKFNPFLSDRYRVGDARHSRMNNEKLKALGWKPENGLRAAVRDYIGWIKNFKNLKEIMDANYLQLQKEGILKNKKV